MIAQRKHAEAAQLYGNRRMPDDPGIIDTFQGSFVSGARGARVLLFWESWCPFSQRAIPALETYYQRFRNDDLDILGVTEVNRTATDETVRAFIEERGLTFPVVKSDGSLNRYFAQQGTPFITLLKDGVMVWQNFLEIPEELPSMLVEGLIADGAD